MYLYMLDKSKGDDELLTQNIKSLYFDHINFTIEAVKNNFASVYRKSQDEIDEIVRDIKIKRSGYFDTEGNNLVTPLKVSALSALRALASTKKRSENIDYIQRHYSHYDRFSKYEHLGDLSFRLIHRQYQEQHQAEMADEIVDAINLLTYTLKSTLDAWPDINENHSKKYNELVTELYRQYSFTK
jgi:hypothetical protein